MRGGSVRKRARELRKNTTDAEQRLWENLRNRQMGSWKFRRQYPVGPFIVDFVCVERKVVVEVDGGQHAIDLERDSERSEYLKGRGYRLLRFWNNEVLEQLEPVLEVIFSTLSGGDAPSPRPSPP